MRPLETMVWLDRGPRPTAVPKPKHGPSTPRLPMPVQTLLFGVWPVPFLSWCQRRYGDTFKIRLPGGASMVVIASPQAVRDVFALPADHFTAADSVAILEPFLGSRSLLLLDGESHKRERRLLAKSFHAEAMATYERVIAETTVANLQTWPIGRPFSLRPHMQAITLEVILRAVFGVSSDADLERYRSPLQRFLRNAGSYTILLPAFRKDLGPWSPWGRFVRLREDVRRMVETEIAKRRKVTDLSARTDVLSFLLRARDEEGRSLDDLSLRDELITMLLAGQDTTATALAWACDLLVQNVGVLDRLAEEIDAGSDAYLDAVVKEVLRLRPTVPEVGRTLSKPASIGGREFPAGTTVTPSLILIHRRPDTYPDPLVFRPERFLERTSDHQTWYPFGGGVRHCLGATFATMEMKVVLKTVLSNLWLSPASKRPSRPRRRAVTLIPRSGGRVVARHR